MLGLAWCEADSCPGCGKSLSETTAPEMDAKDWRITKHVCTSCEMLSITQAASTDQDKHRSAHLWTAERDLTGPGHD